MAAHRKLLEGIRHTAAHGYVVHPMWRDRGGSTVEIASSAHSSEVVITSIVAALGAASLLAFAAVPASAGPADLHMPVVAPHLCAPADALGAITSCSPLGRSRGVGAGLGRL
jgi:hypothetical protein